MDDIPAGGGRPSEVRGNRRWYLYQKTRSLYVILYRTVQSIHKQTNATTTKPFDLQPPPVGLVCQSPPFSQLVIAVYIYIQYIYIYTFTRHFGRNSVRIHVCPLVPIPFFVPILPSIGSNENCEWLLHGAFPNPAWERESTVYRATERVCTAL